MRGALLARSVADSRQAIEVNMSHEGVSDNIVFFWKPPSEFSQWTTSKFTIDGDVYSCAEQYMMAEKAKMFNDEEARNRIMKATSPDVMKKVGCTIRNFVASEWDRACDSVVRKGNLAKFRQNPDMGKRLISTGTKILDHHMIPFGV